MKKYAKIVNEQTKQCVVGIGANTDFYQASGMQEMDVEQAENGTWYLTGYVPEIPDKTYAELRKAAYPALEEQFDMIYWDKINGTNLWQEKITQIKTKYPKQ